MLPCVRAAIDALKCGSRTARRPRPPRPIPRASPALSAAPIAVFRAVRANSQAGAGCGTVAVPLDRVRPSAGTIAIHFEFYPATDTSQPAVSTIVSSSGGPGISNLSDVRLWRAKLQRAVESGQLPGDGSPGIIENRRPSTVPALQHVRGNQVTAARKCGARDGRTAYRYGLGMWPTTSTRSVGHCASTRSTTTGLPMGPSERRAYAFRHPENIRSSVLDSPYGSRDAAFSRTLPTAMAPHRPPAYRRSPRCSISQPGASGDADPVAKAGPARPGARVRPRRRRQSAQLLIVNEEACLGILYNNYFSDPAFLNRGEISAAATALRDGDAVPAPAAGCGKAITDRLRRPDRQHVGWS